MKSFHKCDPSRRPSFRTYSDSMKAEGRSFTALDEHTCLCFTSHRTCQFVKTSHSASVHALLTLPPHSFIANHSDMSPSIPMLRAESFSLHGLHFEGRSCLFSPSPQPPPVMIARAFRLLCAGSVSYGRPLSLTIQQNNCDHKNTVRYNRS